MEFSENTTVIQEVGKSGQRSGPLVLGCARMVFILNRLIFNSRFSRHCTQVWIHGTAWTAKAPPPPPPPPPPTILSSRKSPTHKNSYLSSISRPQKRRSICIYSGFRRAKRGEKCLSPPPPLPFFWNRPWYC